MNKVMRSLIATWKKNKQMPASCRRQLKVSTEMENIPLVSTDKVVGCM